MAEALFNHLAAEHGLILRAGSAGTVPGAAVNPVAAQAMAEVGISLEGQEPKLLTPEMARSGAKLITMGCGVEAEACPAGTYFSEDWGLDDPAGKGIEEVRRIRDEVRARVEGLVMEWSGKSISPNLRLSG